MASSTSEELRLPYDLIQGYRDVMAVKKISISLAPDLAEAIASAAETRGQTLSSWFNEAAHDRLRIERGLAAVAEWEREHGPLSESDRAQAKATLDKLLDRPSRRSA